MHIAMMLIPARAVLPAQHPIRGAVSRRLFHMSRPKLNKNMPAEWLRHVVEDQYADPPRLYAWTTGNLNLTSDNQTSSSSLLSSHDTAGKRCGTLDDYDKRRRIYILGIGNIGRLYAICLSKLDAAPPITLIVHRRELLEHWARQPGIELARHGEVHRSANFDIEWWTDTKPEHGPVSEPRRIGNLIIATKASDAMPQVDRVRRYLDRSSVVAFAQNGMCKMWPPLGARYISARFAAGESPAWIACVTTHGVTSQGPFRSTHASPANALVGPVIPAGSGDDQQMEYFKQQVANAPDLDARQVSRKDLWVAQLEKLVVNSIINPLTAVLRCLNGELFADRGDDLLIIMDKLLREASETLRCLVLDPQSESILLSRPTNGADSKALAQMRQELLERFSFSRLQSMVHEVGAKVVANTSSMLQDVRAGKQTEIDDFNGWLVDTAKLLDKGLQLPTHEKLIALVKTRAELSRRELCAQLGKNTSA
ncbi:ketoisovalerate reductase [Xylariaceae sp. FL0255]|nr:ketoisovalerate reductase [Xylariaceae sp. FL0255]